jgi:hypothetical protein
MHPDHITPQIIDQFGLPNIRRIFGQSIVSYKPGHIPNWLIARKLGKARLLSAEAELHCQEDGPVTPEDWERVADIEGIPEEGFTAPTIKDAVQQLVNRAKLTEVTFDQDFFKTLYEVMRLFSSNAAINKTATYPLLEGPPGASKSLVVNVAAALLGLPVFTVTGSDGSADEIKIQLFGGDTADSSDIHGTVKRYIGYGWLQHPISLKLAATALAEGPLDTIDSGILAAIADHEQIRQNITSYWPGWYPLAANNGCILFLDETNGFRGITTLLTEILENYTRQLHPNFMILGAINPAGEKHERDPLAPEIRSRLVTLPVKAPSQESYQQMMQYLFTGQQPIINLPNGEKKAINVSSMLSVSIPPREHSVLMKLLTPLSFKKFISNLSKAHTAVESKLNVEAILDPRHASSDGCLETRAVDRRLLVRTINAINTALSQAMEADTDFSGKTLSWEEFQTQKRKDIGAKDVIEAIQSTFSTFYFRPFDFPINETIEIAGKDVDFTSAELIVTKIFEQNGLSARAMGDYIKTTGDLALFKAAWLARFKESVYYDEKQINNLTNSAIQNDMQADNPRHIILKSSTGNQPSLCDVTYLKTKTSRQSFRDQNYPGISLRSSTKTALSGILEAAQGTLKAKGRRFLSVDELKQVIPTVYKDLRTKHEKALILTPLYDPTTDTLSMLINMPIVALPLTSQKKYAAKGDIVAQVTPPLVRNGKRCHEYATLKTVEGTLIGEPSTGIDVSTLAEEIIIELTVPV